MGDCTGCQNVRNRNLAILSKSGLNLKRLAIGHAFPISYGKPRITNQVCAPCSASSSLLPMCAQQWQSTRWMSTFQRNRGNHNCSCVAASDCCL